LIALSKIENCIIVVFVLYKDKKKYLTLLLYVSARYCFLISRFLRIAALYEMIVPGVPDKRGSPEQRELK
jgi:hypothetical protein